MIEQLEDRRLFSMVLNGNVVSIVGTEGVDTLHVSQEVTAKGKRVYQFQLNGDVFQVGRSAVRSIYATLLGGTDIAILGRITVPATILGGKGSDVLSGGDGNDTLIGEGGADVLVGRFGDDVLDGGLQGDTLNASAGDDLIVAGSDANTNDLVWGGAGKDTLVYLQHTGGLRLQIGAALSSLTTEDVIADDIEIVQGTASDDFIQSLGANPIKIIGFGGNDTIIGGSGNDTLEGGDGLDLMYGGMGNDLFVAQDGLVDIIHGDAGIDSLFNYDLTDVQLDM